MPAIANRNDKLVGRAQTVADAGLGEDILRTLRIGFDLLPQLPHIDAQILRVGQIIPKLAEQEFMRQHLAGMLNQYACLLYTSRCV